MIVILPGVAQVIEREEFIELHQNSSIVFAYQANYSTMEKGLIVLAGMEDILKTSWLDVYLLQKAYRPV